jgi:hypothetical protein
MTKLEVNAFLFLENTYKIKHSTVSSLYTALEVVGKFEVSKSSSAPEPANAITTRETQ